MHQSLLISSSSSSSPFTCVPPVLMIDETPAAHNYKAKSPARRPANFEASRLQLVMKLCVHLYRCRRVIFAGVGYTSAH